MLNPIVEQDGSIRRFVGISTDVTERKQAERATRQARDEAEASAKRATQAMRDMERMHAATVGREARIMEMKREVNELLAELGRAHRYQHT